MHRLGPFAGLQQPLGHTVDELSVKGLRVTVIERTETHAAGEGCLVPWLGDASNLMDRYDARMLLDDLSSFDVATMRQHDRAEVGSSEDADAGVTAEELDAERYADLDPIRAQLLHTAQIGQNGSDSQLAFDYQEQQSTRGPHHSHEGPAFAYDYDDSSRGQPADTAAQELQLRRLAQPQLPPANAATVRNSTVEQAAQYIPPYDHIPEHLGKHLPSNHRQHQIIAQTAKFVRNNGNQIEVLLRVKHGGNPNFAFLISGDRLFPYYRWLVQHAPQEIAVDEEMSPMVPQHIATDHQDAEEGRKEQDCQQQLHEAPEPPATAESPDSSLGALQLLRAYSMNSEADSEPGDSPDKQQQQPAAEPAVSAAAVVEVGQLVYGPQLPPSGMSTAADSSLLGAQDTSAEEHLTSEQHGQQPQQQQPQQQQQFRSPSPQPIAAVALGADVSLPGQPPAQLHAIIDKLVAFVMRNGIEFERVVRARELHNPRFSFLQPGDQHFAYYRQQLEAALGAAPVRELFDSLEEQQQQQQQQQRPSDTMPAGPEPQERVQSVEAAVNATRRAQVQAAGTAAGAAGTSFTDATSVVAAAAAVGTPRVLLKANPQLVPKRPSTLPAAAAQVSSTSVVGQEGCSPERSVSPALPAEQHQPAAVTTADAATAAAAADQQQQAQLQGATCDSTEDGTATASLDPQQQPSQQHGVNHVSAAVAAADDPGDLAVATQAQKRLKLQVYLRQKRAEQLAEQQQQEHEAKARSILAHRLLLKRLAVGTEQEQDSSSPVPVAAASDDGHLTVQAGAVGSAGPHQAEVEEGEIQQQPVAAAAAQHAEAAARVAAARLLQGSPEPVDTTLPGLKELAGSAAAAAAQHRAALMIDSDEEKPGDAGKQQLQQQQQQMLAAALKAAHQAAAAAGAGPAATPGATADQTPAVTMQQPAAAVADMAAAAKAAAAAIASQAAHVPTILPLPKQTLLLSEPVDISDHVAAAVAEAAAAAAQAAAAANKQRVIITELVQKCTRVSSSSEDSSSRCSDAESDGGQQWQAHHRHGGRSRSRSSGRRSSRPGSSPLPRGDAACGSHRKSQGRNKKGRSRSRNRSRSRSRSRTVQRHKSRGRGNKRSRSPTSASLVDARPHSAKPNKHEKRRHRRHSGYSRRSGSVERPKSSDNRAHGSDGATRPMQHGQCSLPAARTGVFAVAQASNQPAAAPDLGGVPLLDSEQLRQRLRQMMGQIRK